MTIDFRGGTRLPGSLGLGIDPEDSSSKVPRARPPGPLGRQLWDKASVTSSQIPSTKAGNLTVMPLPTKGLVGATTDKDVHVVTLPLYNGNEPHLEDVMQAPGIANCPVAAMLAAFAFTATGRNFLRGIVGETRATVTTDISGIKGNLSNPPPNNILTSARFFTVRIPKGPVDGVGGIGNTVDVSDVLYTNDSDQNWGIYYMRDPAEKSVWASIIEKALAVRLGSYENFDALGLFANDLWAMITNVRPGVFPEIENTPLTEVQIINAAVASTRVPTVAASKDDASMVPQFHGFAMMGRVDSKIKLYDPAKGSSFPISPADFRRNFKNILYRK